MIRAHRKMLLNTLNKVKEVYRRKLPTESHRRAWKNFERILMYRTSLAMLSGTLYDIFGYIAGSTRVQMSR